MNPGRRWAIGAVVCLGLVGQRARAADPSDALFETGHVLDVRLELDSQDWDALRKQERRPGHGYPKKCFQSPPGKPFTWFDARMRLDGQTYERVVVRKKGFFGSLDSQRPSLKVRVDRHIKRQRVAGLKRLTFNNSIEDPSLVHTCLAYDLFARAGVPAPRCNFAHLTVNGADLGVYVHVERIGKPFLRRHFGRAGLGLFEGQESDFRPGWIRTFEPKLKNGHKALGRLAALTRALGTPGPQLLAEVERLVDVEAFLRFWAMEGLVAHEDGYSNNANNFFVYWNPGDARLHFIPWGIDSAMLDVGRVDQPFAVTLATRAGLTHQLYQDPNMRKRFAQRLSALIGQLWSPDALGAQVDRMQSVLRPFLTAAQRDGMRQADGLLRDFLRRRGEVLRAVLAAGLPPEGLPLKEPPCQSPEDAKATLGRE